jgi:prevent-host-death family protein
MEKTWALQDAKARFSEVVRGAETGPQHITVRGEEKVVVVSAKEYHRLRRSHGVKGAKSLYEALRACPFELEIPSRSRERARKVEL